MLRFKKLRYYILKKNGFIKRFKQRYFIISFGQNIVNLLKLPASPVGLHG